MSSTKLPRWVVFDFLGVIVPLGVRSGLSYVGVHTKHAVDSEMIGLMQDLPRKGVSLALASNSGKAWIDSVWKKIDDAPTIAQLITPDMGAAKPQPEYFAHVLSVLKVPASEIVFVDDRQANCMGATDAGIDAVWYQGDVAELRRHIGLT